MARNVIPPPSSDDLALEAQRAGLALACAFSSSDEFEADIIRERRAAGAYGSPRYHRQIVCAGVAAGIALLLAIVLIPG
jgi:hypothetical protein